MFTGIATNYGIIKSIKEKGSNEYTIESDIELSKVKIGSSIMCSGICLTVINKKNKSFSVNVSEETLNVTNAKNWKKGTKLNLEKSLKVGDELGGHIVTGHIDDTSRLLRKRILKKSSELTFELPDNLQKYVCKKGSIAIDGISLTIKFERQIAWCSCITFFCGAEYLTYFSQLQSSEKEVYPCLSFYSPKYSSKNL